MRQGIATVVEKTTVAASEYELEISREMKVENLV
jgi:hypothetical protein